MIKDSDAYSDLVWKNSRIAAKNLHKVKEGKLASYVVGQRLLNEGFTLEEVNSLFDGMNDPNYDADTSGWNDGPDLDPSAPFDEGVYEEAKEVFRRIHNGKF